MLQSTFKTGTGRGVAAKEANYQAIVDQLQDLKMKTDENEVKAALRVLEKVLGRTVEVQKPPTDGGAARKLAELKRGSSNVTKVINGVDVRLDIDQLKHQHPKVRIGTRQKGGGNRFVQGCSADWHKANTMTYMAGWASGLPAMADGDKKYHGQAKPVNGIHYEGFCLKAGGKKFVIFHCYPANNSGLKL